MKGKPILMSDMSGSLGGITAFVGKAGQIFRLRVRATQPNSLAQLEAKSNFGGGAGIFRALSGINKAFWNNFAGGIFSPKDSTNTGQYSGQQAWQSLATSFRNSVANNHTFTVKVNDAVLTGGETFEGFVGPTDVPPSASTNSNLQLQAGGSVSTTLISAIIKDDGNHSLKIQVGDGTGNDIDSFLNASGAKVGYASFMSSGNPSANMGFKSKLRYLLGYFNHVEATVPADLDAVNNFEFTGTVPINIAKYKKFPGLGETVLVSVFAVDINNQMSLVGSVETTVVAA